MNTRPGGRISPTATYGSESCNQACGTDKRGSGRALHCCQSHQRSAARWSPAQASGSPWPAVIGRRVHIRRRDLDRRGLASHTLHAEMTPHSADADATDYINPATAARLLVTCAACSRQEVQEITADS